MSADPAQAVALYRKAADLGDSQALHNLGWLYDGGRGVPRDPKEAARLVLSAIEKGNGASLAQLAGASRMWSSEFRREVQSLMKARKIYRGPVDGQFTDQTRAALRTVAGFD